MSSNKEEKRDAADRIKAAALMAAKGLSRAQAERAATAAARNVNAYGQKEEGPSRWQERKEAKRQMYLWSTEKGPRVGELPKHMVHTPTTTAVSSTQCQKCYQPGHWSFECKNERVYISRPSRTKQLKNPKLRTSFLNPSELDYPDMVDEPKAEKKSSTKKKEKKKSKRKHSDSESGSEASVFESDSSSDDDNSSAESESSSSSLSSLDSGERKRRLRRQKNEKMKKRETSKGKKKHQKRRYSSSSDSACDSESDSESDSGGRDNRKRGSKRHSRKR